jgi:alkylated DNA repair dioxygenase AlkB
MFLTLGILPRKLRRTLHVCYGNIKGPMATPADVSHNTGNRVVLTLDIINDVLRSISESTPDQSTTVAQRLAFMNSVCYMKDGDFYIVLDPDNATYTRVTAYQGDSNGTEVALRLVNEVTKTGVNPDSLMYVNTYKTDEQKNLGLIQGEPDPIHPVTVAMCEGQPRIVVTKDIAKMWLETMLASFKFHPEKSGHFDTTILLCWEDASRVWYFKVNTGGSEPEAKVKKCKTVEQADMNTTVSFVLKDSVQDTIRRTGLLAVYAQNTRAVIEYPSKDNLQTLVTITLDFLSPEESKHVMTYLMSRIDEFKTRTFFGNTPTRRMFAMSVDSSLDYPYSGHKQPSENWSGTIIEKIAVKLSEVTGIMPNFVLFNYYEDGGAGISYHHDDENAMCDSAPVWGVSIGSMRHMNMKLLKPIEGEPNPLYKTPMPDGSLFTMGLACQRTHKHSVPKTKKVVGPRISMTFRLFNL